jgi:elongation factor Ts
MSVSAEQIKELRQATGAGILECRNALETTGGDLEKATELLREKGLATAAKRADRETREGVLDLYSHGDGRVGVMVEVNCETDFVARSDAFRSFAHEVALQIAAGAPRYVRAEDIPPAALEQEREKARRFAREEGKPEAVLDRIVEGKLEKFLDDVCLLRQPYIRDDSLTVEKLLLQNIAAIGENILIRRFVRWELGESSAS